MAAKAEPTSAASRSNRRTRGNADAAVSTSQAAQTAAELDRAQSAEGVGAERAVTAVDAAAEARLLSALLADHALLDEVTEVLLPEDFGVPAHEVIFRAILSCDASNRAVDPVTVTDELTRSGELRRIGGVETVTAVAETSPATFEFGDYVELVRDRSTRRRLLAAARTIGMSALSGESDAADLIGQAEKVVFDVTSTRAKSTAMTMPQVVAAVHAQMAKVRTSKLVGYSTGMEQLDRITGGLQPGQLVIIAGRPGSGKSVLASQFARHVAEVNDVTVPFLSYEMQAHEIGLRQLASATGIPLGDLKLGRVPDGMDGVLAREAEKMAQLRMLIDDKPPTTFTGLRSAMRKLNRRVPLGMLVVDYLQLMGAEAGVREDNRAYVVGAISRGLKLLADELEIPIIAVSQLNRGPENRAGGGRPLLSDLRESGSLEQDASMVILVHRAVLNNPEAPDNEAELIVAKNRNGEAPYTILADWQGPQVRFRDTGRRPDFGGGRPQGALEQAAGRAAQPGAGPAGGPGAGGFGGGFAGGGFAGGRTVDPFDGF